MTYRIKLFVLNWDDQEEIIVSKDYELEIRDLFKEPVLNKNEKIMPVSYWRRALPIAAAEIVKNLEAKKRIIGLDFQYIN